MNKDLLKLIQDNRDLPVYAWVEPDVVQDEYHYWAGRFKGNATIREFVELDYSYTHATDCDWLFEDDTEDWEEYMLNEVYDELSEDEAKKKMQEELDNMRWKKAIFVYIETL